MRLLFGDSLQRLFIFRAGQLRRSGTHLVNTDPTWYLIFTSTVKRAGLTMVTTSQLTVTTDNITLTQSTGPLVTMKAWRGRPREANVV